MEKENTDGLKEMYEIKGFGEVGVDQRPANPIIHDMVVQHFSTGKYYVFPKRFWDAVIESSLNKTVYEPTE